MRRGSDLDDPRPSTADSLSARVDRVFADDGPLARTLDGFEARAGQRRLAAEVARTFENGGTLVAEAGTGTGKTMAYLVPAVLSGQRVLISTGTRTLQDQIFYKDVSALAQALGAPIRAAYMKGRTNYLCRHRFERLGEASAGMTADERRWLARVAEWAEVTDTGDRAEIDDLPDDLALWSEFTATSEQCLGRECPRHGDCFVTRMRDRATEADIVIVNHHLLCADASVRQGDFGEVIPACDLAVIDEAHQLEEIVTQYFGIALGTYRLDELCRDGARAVGTIAADDARFAMAVTGAISDVQRMSRRFFDAVRVEIGESRELGDRRPQSSVSDGRATVTPETADRLYEAGRDLRQALETLIEPLKARAEMPPDLASLRARAAAIVDDLTRLLAPDDGRYVHFIESRGRSVTLRAAPIDVADLVRDAVLAGRRATVLTSATLTVESSFDYTLARLGAEDARTIRLPPEFDFRSQAILFLPRDMPDPRSPGFNRAAATVVLDILTRTRGRAFVLFTSYAALREVLRCVDGRVPWPLLVQGSAPRSALLREFRTTPNAVLFATASFWQGVDVVGEALSAVIIDRLPFASPADPLVAARVSAIRARGGDPFGDYQIPVATLTLLQGLGRLIRSRTDRGILAVLDPRLTRMAYGRRFLASLPPAPVTTDLADIEAFLAC